MAYLDDLMHPVKSFKTRGGSCFLCAKRQDNLERHHEEYYPERCVFLCHECHFRIHFQRWLLTATEKEKLLCTRFDRPLLTVAQEKGISVDSLINGYDPPTRPKSWKKQWIENIPD